MEQPIINYKINFDHYQAYLTYEPVNPGSDCKNLYITSTLGKCQLQTAAFDQIIMILGGKAGFLY